MKSEVLQVFAYHSLQNLSLGLLHIKNVLLLMKCLFKNCFVVVVVVAVVVVVVVVVKQITNCFKYIIVKKLHCIVRYLFSD